MYSNNKTQRLILKNMWVDVDKIANKKLDVDKIWGFISIQPQKNDHLVLTIFNFYKVNTYMVFQN
jgi:hypothetical protein